MAVRALIELTPTEALVRDASGERRVAVDRCRPGAVIVIRPGEKVPLDGEVVAGVSAINQAPVTGESMPIDKGPGDEVFAGSINGRGALEFRVTRFRRDTTLARIIHLVEQAQAQRAPAQTFVERFARVYTPAVIALAVGLAVVPPLAFGAAWHDVDLSRPRPAGRLLSVRARDLDAGVDRRGACRRGDAKACSSRAARIWSAPATIRCVAFDKTGTLTRGAARSRRRASR